MVQEPTRSTVGVEAGGFYPAGYHPEEPLAETSEVLSAEVSPQATVRPSEVAADRPTDLAELSQSDSDESQVIVDLDLTCQPEISVNRRKRRPSVYKGNFNPTPNNYKLFQKDLITSFFLNRKDVHCTIRMVFSNHWTVEHILESAHKLNTGSNQQNQMGQLKGQGQLKGWTGWSLAVALQIDVACLRKSGLVPYIMFYIDWVG